MRRPFLALALLAASSLAQAESAGGPPARPAAAGHAVILKDGTRIECVEAPLVALGRVLYVTADGTRHALPADRVDLEKTRPAQRATPVAPAPPVAAHGAPASTRQAPAVATASRRAAPDFEARRADGTAIKLSQLKGKVVLIDFWATWCGPCVVEMPNVKKVYEKHAGPNFEIVGVSLDQRRADLDAFLKAQGIAWPQSFDGKGWGNAVAQQYGINSIPTMMLVDRSGRIARVGVRGHGLEPAVAELIAEPAAGATPKPG